MREIEGIEKAIEQLQPHWEEIEARFNEENERFKKLLSQDHDVMGRILKCHLIVEHYLDRYLSENLGLENFDDARLSFFQKAALLPAAGAPASSVKPGIIKLNSIRNRFGHNLEARIDEHELGAINELLAIARSGTEFRNSIERLEAFTTIVCTWLIVPPPHLEKVFIGAFAQVRVQSAKRSASS